MTPVWDASTVRHPNQYVPQSQRQATGSACWDALTRERSIVTMQTPLN